MLQKGKFVFQVKKEEKSNRTRSQCNAALVLFLCTQMLLKQSDLHLNNQLFIASTLKGNFAALNKFW